jgi:hypothetical protein
MAPTPTPTPTEPFIAWTDGDDWLARPTPLRRSCEAYLREEMDKLHPLVGAPAIEGIIIYDKLERGLAVASLLGKGGRTLPFSSDGASCDGLFDEVALCHAVSEHCFMAAVHEGSRGMLLRLNPDEGRRVLLMPRHEASQFSPLGRKNGAALGPAAVGLLAHELAHARDYADGRPGLPSLDEVAARCTPSRAPVVHAITDVALAEYVATRVECAAQVAAFGGCAEDLTSRIRSMAKFQPKPVRWEEKASDSIEHQQVLVDRNQLGYTLGTLAAYAHAKAPVVGNDGLPWDQTTEEMATRGAPRGAPMAALFKAVGPALERAATEPSAATAAELARAVEVSVLALEARSNRRSLSFPAQR